MDCTGVPGISTYEVGNRPITFNVSGVRSFYTNTVGTIYACTADVACDAVAGLPLQ